MSDEAVVAEGGSPAGPGTGGAPAPIETALSAREVVDRLDRAARRGRLPGFEPGSNGVLFTVAAHGNPFDKDMMAVAEPAPGGGTRITWRLRLRPTLPAVFAVVILLTIWPGVLLTDTFLRGFEFYRIETWWWYLPLTILPLPWLYRAVMRKTDASTAESAAEAAAKIAGELRSGEGGGEKTA